MKNKDIGTVGRRSLMGSMGVAALAGVALGTVPSQAQAAFKPKKHKLDKWMNQIPGDHRVFIDTSDAAGGSNALRYGTNIINAQVNAYEGSDDEMAMIICYRHTSTPFGFNDAMWEKYGDSFVGFTQQFGPDGKAPTTNTLTRGIQGLADRGVHFAVCNAATTLVSGMIARAAGLEQEDVLAELHANAIPNAHFVPAGVMAVTRAQEYGYSLLYSAA